MGQAVGHYRRRLAEARAGAEQAGLPFSAPGLDATDGMHLARTAFGLALARYAEDKAVKCLVERTPEHVLAMPELERLVPGALFVHVVRDGRDEAVAAWDHNLKTEGDAFAQRHPAFAGVAETFARSWTHAVASARAFGREHPERFLEVKVRAHAGSADAHPLPSLPVSRRRLAGKPAGALRRGRDRARGGRRVRALARTLRRIRLGRLPPLGGRDAQAVRLRRLAISGCTERSATTGQSAAKYRATRAQRAGCP
ncbi:MAG: hypothetical protein EXR02_06215 [Rhodospirillales bacterium]|nr:hypothetical protein [Rhodospirillales bacterium]